MNHIKYDSINAKEVRMMIKSLKNYMGLLFILLIFLLNTIFWFTATPLFDQPLESTIGQWQGANIILGFTVVFFLATKNRFVVFLFNGLEKSYKYHRVIAMISFLLIFVHAQFSNLIWSNFIQGLPLSGREMGLLARNLFIVLIVLALLAKYMKYEHWRLIHRLMVIPYLAAVYHAFTLSSYPLLDFSFLSIWMIFMAGIGTFSSFYMIFMYRYTAFPFKGKIISVHRINETVTELEVSLEQHYIFETGQFTFIKIKDKPFNHVPHPFSISGVKNHHLLFTIKALGDFTKDIYHYLKENQSIEIAKPFGHMTFNTHKDTQVWIAGGIGVTPFLSHLRTTKDPHQTIRLYYSVNDQKEAVHLDLLDELSNKLPNFSYQLIESNKTGFLSVDQIDFKDDPDILMCGPRPMALSLAKAIKKKTPKLHLTFEAFSFSGTFVEDLVRLQKKWWRKINRKD
jgi:predicted ferric reductase